MKLKLIAIFLTLNTASHSFAVLIDDFSAGPIVVERTGVEPAMVTQTNLASNRVIGGARRIVVGVTGLPNQRLEIGNSTLNGFVPENLFDATVTYGDAESLLGAGLVADGSDAFRFDFFGSEIVNGDILVQSGEESGSFGFRFSGNGSVTIPFTAFEDVDFDNISSVSLGVYRSGSFSISNFRTVPEPTMPLWVAVSAIPLLCRRKIG